MKSTSRIAIIISYATIFQILTQVTNGKIIKLKLEKRLEESKLNLEENINKGHSGVFSHLQTTEYRLPLRQGDQKEAYYTRLRLGQSPGQELEFLVDTGT